VTDWLEADSPERIDLSSHAIVEASAGTGKTYTLEHLVLQLLEQAETTLEQILVVTFTDKATGELKQRIRALIVERLADNPQHIALREALASFDRAQIMTIHGFCKQILFQHAFENRLPLESEISNQKAIAERLFAQHLRTVWANEYLPGLPTDAQLQILEQEFFRRPILELTEKLRPENRLLPQVPDLDERCDVLDRILGSLSEILGPVAEPVELTQFYQQYSKLDFSRTEQKGGLRSADVLSKLIRPLLSCLREYELVGTTNEEVLARLNTWYGQISYKRFLDEGFDLLVPPRYQPEGLGDACPAFAPALPLLKRLGLELQPLRAMRAQPGLTLAVREIQALRQELAEYKNARGLISYDDMLTSLSTALNPAKNDQADALVRVLRQRYRIAFVDEFQDTDETQWEIFARLFAESADGHRLCLIGDPKQAIYGFRGADIATYRRAVTRLHKDFGAPHYVLPTNWRSDAALIDAYNLIFCDKAWFGESYIPVRAAPAVLARRKLVQDDTGREAVTVIDLSEEDRTAAEAMRLQADFIAAEIQALLSDRGLTYSDGDSERTLAANDIAVLVRTAREARDLEAAFRRTGVPFAYYKKGGLYKTDEAYHLHLMLTAVHRCYDDGALRRALLSPFFGIPVDALWRTELLTSQHTLRALFTRWQEWARARNWSLLFHSLLYDTGLLQRLAAEPHGERAGTNYQHILQELHEIAIQRGFELPDVANHLHNCISGTIELRDEAEIQRLDSERTNVQIMTMHVSKGLEFPVVFVAGGFSPSFYARYWKVRKDGVITYDLTKDLQLAMAHKREEDEEYKRLFYVALTRAVHKLYVPFYTCPPGGRESAISSFVCQAIRKNWLQDCPTVSRVSVTALRVPAASADAPKTPMPASKDFIPLPAPPAAYDYSARSKRVLSFSSLHQHDAASDQQPDARAADEPVHREPSADKALPPGTATGSMLHGIFEFADWRIVREAHSATALEATSVAEIANDCIDEFNVLAETDQPRSVVRAAALDLVYRNLRAQLPGDIVLTDLPEKDKIAEMSFLFPHVDGGRNALKGFVDLLFRVDGRYFILDWKSNWLERYDQPAVAQAMSAAGYHLQYKLYTCALARWLCPHSDAEFLQQFGGAYYLFLRGVDAPGGGVFFRRPAGTAELQEWRDDVDSAIATRMQR